MECRTFSVPKEWNVTTLTGVVSSPNINFFVRRVQRTGTVVSHARSPREIWIVGGRPGSSGAPLERLISYYKEHFDVYIPDMRGTGNSGRVACKEVATGGLVPYQLPACLAEVSTEQTHGDLGLYSATMAAADIVHVASSLNHTMGLLAVGHGGTVALRMLQLLNVARSSLLTGFEIVDVIMDSPLAPDLFSFTSSLEYPSSAATALLQACGQDGECSKRVGTDPLGLLRGLLAALDAEPVPVGAGVPEEAAQRRNAAGAWFRCQSAGFDGRLLRRAVGRLIGEDGAFVSVPALLRRLVRCAPSDVTALQSVAQYVWEEDNTDRTETWDSPNSGVVMLNLLIGESRPEDLSPADLENEELRGSRLATLMDPELVAFAGEVWPPLAQSALTARFYPASTSVNLHILSGLFDSWAPQAMASRVFHMIQIDHISGAHGHFQPEMTAFVAPHMVTLWPESRVGVNQCVASFFVRVGGISDCLKTTGFTTNVSFASPSAADRAVFGIDDVWGDTVATPELDAFPGRTTNTLVQEASETAAIIASVFSLLGFLLLLGIVGARCRRRPSPSRGESYLNML